MPRYMVERTFPDGLVIPVTVYRQVQDAASSTIIRFGVTKAGRQRYQCTRWRERWRA